MLQNAYFLAKIGADTAEDEQHFAEICQKLATTYGSAPAGAKQLKARWVATHRHATKAAAFFTPESYPRDFVHDYVGKSGKICFFFANFWRARSPLYQKKRLQENMRLTAFFKIYKLCTLLHRSKLSSFEKMS